MICRCASCGRSDAATLASHSEWVDRLDDKNRSAGTSAPTLVFLWSGPLDLLGALATHRDRAGITVQEVTVESEGSL